MESPRWVQTIAAFILGNSLSLVRETFGKRDFGIGHEDGDGVLGDRASAPREREPVGRGPARARGCSVGSFAVIAG